MAGRTVLVNPVELKMDAWVPATLANSVIVVVQRSNFIVSLSLSARSKVACESVSEVVVVVASFKLSIADSNSISWVKVPVKPSIIERRAEVSLDTSCISFTIFEAEVWRRSRGAAEMSVMAMKALTVLL